MNSGSKKISGVVFFSKTSFIAISFAVVLALVFSFLFMHTEINRLSENMERQSRDYAKLIVDHVDGHGYVPIERLLTASSPILSVKVMSGTVEIFRFENKDRLRRADETNIRSHEYHIHELQSNKGDTDAQTSVSVQFDAGMARDATAAISFLAFVLIPVVLFLFVVVAMLSWRLLRDINNVSTFADDISRTSGATLDQKSCSREINRLIDSLNKASKTIFHQKNTIAENALVLERAYDAASIGSWQADISRKMVDWSPEFRNILGVSADARPSIRRLIKLVHPDDVARVKKFIRSLRDMHGKSSIVFRIVRADKKSASIYAVADTLVIPGSERRAFGIIQDITDRKQMDDLEYEVEHLNELNRVKSDFISVASHELRTPLTSIKSFAEILLDDLESISTADQREYLSIIDSEADRLSRLISNLMDVQKIESGRMSFNDADIDIRGIVHSATSAMINQFKSKDLELIVDAMPDELIVFCDRDRVHQVLINLLTNAMKFTDDGHVKVCAQKTAFPPKIMILESSDKYKDILKSAIELGGAECVIFDNGTEALAYLMERSHEIDAILCDVSLGGMSAIEILRSARLNFPHLPILMTKEDGEDICDHVVGRDSLGVILKDMPGEVLYKHIRCMLTSVANIDFSNRAIMVSVEDTGIGIPDSDRFKVFEKFHRVDGQSVKDKDGSGLGLSIVREIIARYRGRVWVESSLGSGSKFVFTLPERRKPKKKLGTILIESGLVTHQQICEALDMQS